MRDPRARARQRATAAVADDVVSPASAAEDGAADVADSCEHDRWHLSREPLRALVGYGRKVYGLDRLLNSVRDGRRQPRTSAPLVAAAVFFCGLLRIRSFNALEPKLCEKPFVRLVGAAAERDQLCSVDTLGRSLCVMDLESARAPCIRIVAKAERNKVFREGWIGALRYVALDGWEPIASFHRHCTHCLVRNVRVQQSDGQVVEHEQYYHRYAVAMLIDERFDLLLDIEPLLPNDLRPKGAAKDDEDEGELTAGKRLLQRVKKTFPWIDAVVADALYANGPFLTVVHQLRMSAVVIAKKQTDEPLKEAQSLWATRPPESVVVDPDKKERVELWDCPQLETLSSYKGQIRVVRAQLSDLEHPNAARRTWCMLVTGKAAHKLSAFQVLRAARGRWHIENTGFHQWTTRWHFTHVFIHDPQALLALFWLFFAAFNLLTLFLYRQLRSYGRDRGKDVTRTISRLIDLMLDELARLDASPWDSS